MDLIGRRFGIAFVIAVWLAILAHVSPAVQTQPARSAQGSGGPPAVEQTLERMTKNLNLTEEQQNKIKPILEEQVKQMQASRQDTSLTAQQRRQKMQEVQKEYQQKINQVLTPEQVKKREQIRQSTPKSRPIGRGRRGPGQTQTGQ